MLPRDVSGQVSLRRVDVLGPVEVEDVRAHSGHQPDLVDRHDVDFHERRGGLLDDVDVLTDPRLVPLGCGGQDDVRGVDAVLKADRRRHADAKRSRLDFILCVEAGEHAAIALVDLVAHQGIPMVQKEGEVIDEAQLVVGRIGVGGHPLVVRQPPQVIDVEVVPGGVLAALGGIDRAEAVDQPLPDGPLRDLPRPTPVGLGKRRPQGQLHVLGQRRAGLGEDVQAVVAARMVEGAVVVIPLDGDERLQGIAGRGEERQVALGVEAAAGDLERVLGHEVLRPEVHHARGVEVPVLGKVRCLQDVDHLDRFRDEEVEVRIALAVGVTPQVHRQPVDEQRQVRAVVGVKAPDQILFGLATPLVLGDDQAGDQPQHVGRPALWANLEVLAGNELFGRGRNRRRRRDEERRQDQLLSGCRRRRRLEGLLRSRLLLGAGHSGEADKDKHRRHADHPVSPTASLTHGPRSAPYDESGHRNTRRVLGCLVQFSRAMPNSFTTRPPGPAPDSLRHALERLRSERRALRAQA